MGHSQSPNPEIISSNRTHEKTSVENVENTRDCNNTNIVDEKKHKCTYDGCQAAFRKHSRLLWHIRQHTGERPYKCTFKDCEKSYTVSSHLKRHQQSHQNFTASVICPICSLPFKSRQNLLKHHARMHTENGRLVCQKCGVKFRKKYNLAEHLATHDGIYHSCTKCQRKFSSSYLLEKHMKVGHIVRTHVCTKKGCDKVFNLWREMIAHKKEDHPKEHKCRKCEKIFRSKVHLKLHMQSHTEENFLTCPYENCPKFYIHQRNLNVHIKVKHLSMNFTCDICKSNFQNKSSVRRHIKAIHESTVKPKNTKKGNRKKRKDAGTRTKSMLAKLVGLELPIHVEKQLLVREVKINPTDTLFPPAVSM